MTIDFSMARVAQAHWIGVVILCCALAGCTAEDKMRGKGLEIITPDQGARVPKGVSQIEKGMSQKDVLQILSPMYEVRHSAFSSPNGPFADFFVYTEDNAKKLIEVFYTGDAVVAVRFGFTSAMVIE